MIKRFLKKSLSSKRELSTSFDFQLLKEGRPFPKNEGDWVYELKYDGWRIMAFVDGHGKARLVSRNKKEVAEKFISITNALSTWAKQSIVLDGELVSVDKFGRCDFHAVKSGENLVYVVFDILVLDGSDLRGEPLLKRKSILKTVLSDAPECIQYSEHISGNGRELFVRLCASGHEGIVSKLATSTYSGTRNGDWLKYRCENYQRRSEHGAGKQEDSKKASITQGNHKYINKSANELEKCCNKDECGSCLKISNPQKKIFKGITKKDIADYYQAVSKRMLPYLKGRYTSQVRCPNGVGDGRLDVDCFFKRKPPLVINSVDELLSEVQMNTIEFHVPGSRAEAPDKPDIMVFDLDPPLNKKLADVRRGALDLRMVLAELGLESFVKTSGGKGYHVVVPITCESGWEVFSCFAKNTAALLEQRWQDRYTINIRKDKRDGKIFIDWLRNTGASSTTAAPYSIRAKSKEAVSMPISWDEIDKVAPDAIDIKQAAERITQPDPWIGFFKTMKKQKLISKK